MTRYSFGARLRAARAAKQLTQQGLAQAASISYAAVRKLESGDTTRPSIQIARSLATALGVSLDYLGGLTDHMQPQGGAA